MMKRNHKLGALLLAAVIFALGTLPARAGLPGEPLRDRDYYEVNEYDYLAALQAMSLEELRRAGYTDGEIARIMLFSLEDELYKRAWFSREKLRRCGYTEEQIGLLMEYRDGAVLTVEEARGLTATFTGRVSFREPGEGDPPLTTRMSAAFSWSWSHLPLWTGTDVVSCEYLAVNDGNREMMILSPSESGDGCTIFYRGMGENGDKTAAAEVQKRMDVRWRERTYEIPLVMKDEGGEYWAESGAFVRIIQEGAPANRLRVAFFEFSYGHMAEAGHRPTELWAETDDTGEKASLTVTFPAAPVPAYNRILVSALFGRFVTATLLAAATLLCVFLFIRWLRAYSKKKEEEKARSAGSGTDEIQERDQN